MKKIAALLLLLLISVTINAQERPDWDYKLNTPISAFFPQTLPIMASDYVLTQNTYYEYNWTGPNITTLVEKRMGLTFIKDVNKDNYITHTYKSKAGRVIDELTVKFNIFTYYGLYVVSSVEVYGSHAQVTKFFILLYNSSGLQSGNKTVSNYIKTFGQENAVYSVAGNTAKVKIVNTVYKNTDEFKANFEKLKESYKNRPATTEASGNENLSEERRKEEQQWIADKAQQRKKDSVWAAKMQNEKVNRQATIYYFTKSGSKVTFKDGPKDSELESKITTQAAELKKGKYTAYVVSYTQGGNINYEIKFNPVK